MAKSKITIVLPTKNEAQTIAEIIGLVRPYVDEILVVDGHSSDQTRDIAAAQGARVVLDHAKGKGEALRVGIAEAGGDIIIFMDTDGSHEAKDIPALIKPLIEGSADLVVASRGLGGSDELHGDFEKLMRLIFSSVITLIINYRFNVRLTDSQNGFRAIRTDFARRLRLRENIFTIEQEMLIKSLKRRGRVAEIPSHEYSRRHGRSGISLWRMGWRYAWSVLINIF